MAKLQFLLAGLYATSALASPWARIKRGGGWGDGGPGGNGESTSTTDGYPGGYGGTSTCQAITVTKTQKASTVYQTQKPSTVSKCIATLLPFALGDKLSRHPQHFPEQPSIKRSQHQPSPCWESRQP